MPSLKEMPIKFTKAQYRDLIMLVALGNSTMGTLGDVMPDKKYKKISDRFEELESHLLELAEQFESPSLVKTFRGETIMSQDFYEGKVRKFIEEYEDYVFWHELETRMGKRDFERTKTKEEEKEIKESGGMLPHRISEIYEKYRQEFEKHGIERLGVKEK